MDTSALNGIKLPVTIAAVLLSGSLALGGYLYGQLAGQLKDTQATVLQLRIDVAVMKAELLAQIDRGEKAREK